jgi:phosphohistidine phosphatase SixA
LHLAIKTVTIVTGRRPGSKVTSPRATLRTNAGGDAELLVSASSLTAGNLKEIRMDTCRRMLHTARLSTLLGALVLLPWLVVPGLRPVQAQPASPAPAAGSAEQDRLVQALRGGGLVVLIRHSATAPGVGDPPGFRMDDCPTQRNLIDAGRAQAERIGQWFRQHGIEPTSLRASPWCRTRETATLAFGRSDDWPALSNLLGDRSRQKEHAKEVLDAIARIGANDVLVLVSHGVTIDAFIGEYLQQGEMVVVRPARSATTAASGSASGAAATSHVDRGRQIEVVGRLLVP